MKLEDIKMEKPIRYIQICQIVEEPMYSSKEYELRKLPSFSETTIGRLYDKLVDIPYEKFNEKLVVYLAKNDTTAVLGHWQDDRFFLLVELALRPDPFVKNISFNKKIYQVSRVEADTRGASKGYATALYSILVRELDCILFSDRTQYFGGRKLWGSIVKNQDKEDINIFIYNSETKEIMKDKHGEPIKYDGQNIPEDEIWKDGVEGKKILLFIDKK